MSALGISLKSVKAVLAPSPAWIFAFHTTITAIIALYVAFELQLDSPVSAANTVFILANPMRGMVLSKGLYRALGTIIGVVGSFLLMDLFAQTSMLFMIGFAIWLGVCTAIATLLRYFRAYAAVLAGYTISLVIIGAVDHPEATFDLGMSRLAAVVLGIVVSGLMTVILPPDQGRARLHAQLKTIAAELSKLICDILKTPEDEALTQRQRKLIRTIQAIDPLIESAGAESVATAARVSDMRILSGRLYEVVSLLPAIHQSLLASRNTEGPRDDDEYQELEAILEAIRTWLATHTNVLEGQFMRGAGSLRERAIRLNQRFSTHEHGVFAELMLLDRLDDLLSRLPGVLMEAEARSVDMPAPALKPRIRFHNDPHIALVNGVRSAIAVLFAYAVWYWTGWSDGVFMLLAIAPICSLLALADNPDAGSVMFLEGIILAAVVGLPWTFLILAQISDFSLLALALGVPFVLAAYAMTKPRFALPALGFLIFFNAFVNVTNPMKYSITNYLNTALGITLGSITAVFVFRLVFPASPRQRALRLGKGLLADVETLALTTDLNRFAGLQNRMYDRMAHLIGVAGVDDDTRSMLDMGGHAALRLGFEIGRLRTMLYRYPVLEAAIGTHLAEVFTRLHMLRQAPAAAFAEANRVSTMLFQEQDTHVETLQPLLGSAARSLGTMTLLMSWNRRFFSLSDADIRAAGVPAAPPALLPDAPRINPGS
jgi:uncharacterized membrane protein YccC